MDLRINEFTDLYKKRIGKSFYTFFNPFFSLIDNPLMTIVQEAFSQDLSLQVKVLDFLKYLLL